MSEIEFIDLVTPTGSVVKAVFVRLKPEQDMHDIEPIAKNIARKIGMGRVDVLDYVWSERAQGWAVLVQKKLSLHASVVKVEQSKVVNQASLVAVRNKIVQLVGGWDIIVKNV
jgi:hypothetical protein